MANNLIDVYEILEVSSQASLKEIKNAFKAFVKTHHPDATVDLESEEKKFRENLIKEVTGVISDWFNPTLTEEQRRNNRILYDLSQAEWKDRKDQSAQKGSGTGAQDTKARKNTNGSHSTTIKISENDLGLVKALIMFYKGEVPDTYEVKIKRSQGDVRADLSATVYVVSKKKGEPVILRTISDLLYRDTGTWGIGYEETDINKDTLMNPLFWEESYFKSKISGGTSLKGTKDYYGALDRIARGIAKPGADIAKIFEEEGTMLEIFYKKNDHLYSNKESPKKERLLELDVSDIEYSLKSQEGRIEISPSKEAEVMQK